LDLAGLAPLIRCVGDAARRVTKSHIGEVIALVSGTRDAGRILPGWDAFLGLDLTITSWANMGAYDCDFGEALGISDGAGTKARGLPLFLRVPFVNHYDGLCIVLPRRRADTDEILEVVLILNAEDARSLESDVVVQSWLR